MNPITIINRFTVKSDKMDEFIARQQAFAATLRQLSPGFVGGRMYCALDGKTAVLLSQFASTKAQEEIRHLDAFKLHVAGLQPLVESVSPELYQEAYSTGEFR